MAGSRSLGVLTLDLVARVGGFEKGMQKAEREAEARSRAISKAINQAAQIGITAFGALATAGVAAFAVLNRQAENIAGFQGLSEKIGDTAEAVASLKLASDVSGVSLDTIGAASIRLTASLSKTDDEAKGVGAAIKALGLNFADFKRLSPVEQLDAVAKKMGEFADGSEKTAVAVALFGKAGAELIPFLNDLADGSERQILLTSEQIKQADEYTKQTARLKSEFESFIQFQTAQAIPTMSDVQDILAEIAKNEATVATATDLVKLALGAAIVVFQTLAVVGSDVGFVFLSVGREIGAWAAQLNALARGDLQGFRAISDAVKADGVRARAELDKFQKRIMSIGQTPFMDDEIRRLQNRSAGANAPASRPRIDTSGLTPNDNKASKAAEQAAKAAQAYLENLRKQLQATEDLSVAETVLRDIQSGRLKLAGGVTQEELVGIARQIDSAKELTKTLEEQKKAREAIAETQKRIDDQAIAGVEAMIKSNEALREEVEVIGLQGNALAAVEMARLDNTIALKEEALAMAQNAEASVAVISSLEREISLLKQRREILSDKGAREEEVKAMEESLKRQEQAYEKIQDALGDGLYDIATGNFDNIGKSFTQMLTKMATEAIAADLMNLIFGKGGKSGGGFGDIFSIFTSFFAPGKANGGGVMAGGMYQINENSPEVLAMGGKQYLMMGNQGGTVMPNVGGRSISMTVVQQFAPGTDRRTVSQGAADARRQLEYGARNL